MNADFSKIDLFPTGISKKDVANVLDAIGVKKNGTTYNKPWVMKRFFTKEFILEDLQMTQTTFQKVRVFDLRTSKIIIENLQELGKL